MTEGIGSQQLVRTATAYATSVAFGVSFLVATLTGCDGLTALLRSAIALLVALVAANLLAPPVVDAVLAAMARDGVRRQSAQQVEDDA